MLKKVKTFKGYRLHGLDGNVGTVKEFYFDDHHWTIRYLVADTGSWLADRQVLVSPYALGAVNAAERSISVALTRKQIEDSPPLNSDKPVSRQFEEAYYGYFGWPLYWRGPYLWGANPYPHTVRGREELRESALDEKASWDANLRSTHDVDGLAIEAPDGAIGHVDDLIIDDETWAIRYLIIHTRDWWPGKRVLISPKWVERISGIESKVFVNHTRETIKQAPEYSEGSLLTRDYEVRLHGHYNRRGYWLDEPADGELPRRR